MSPETLSAYLHRNIPLTAAMKLTAAVSATDHVVLRCPLGPNRNHHDTAFGGSLSAALMLSGWAMMRLRMGAAGLLDVAGLGLESAGVIGSDDPVDSVRLVVSKSTMDFLHPVTKDFEVECRFDDEVLWQRFVDRFTANRWAKIRLHSVALVEHRIMARLKATYVAVRGGGPADELREELGN